MTDNPAQRDALRPGSENLKLGFLVAELVPGYRGIDRLPSLPDFNELQYGPARLIWDDYLSAFESGDISRRVEVAERCATAIRQLGRELEVIYGQVLEVDLRGGLDRPESRKSVAWLMDRDRSVPLPPTTFRSIGLDVSIPVPNFHSVIVQPGAVERNDRFRSQLNEFGLIDDLDYARSVCHQSNRRYIVNRYEVVRVFAAG